MRARPIAAALLLLICEVLIMDRNFARVMPLVLKHEGGYVNHPKDPGGHTNKGVTLATFRVYKPKATVADLKAISTDMVHRIYRDGYWNKVRGDDLPSGLDYAVFDFAVNSGPGRAAKYLQAAVGVKQDGIIGPETLRAVSRHDTAKLINALCDARMAFLRKLPTWGTFGKGWSSRVTGVRKEALALAASPTIPTKPETVVVVVEESPAQPKKNGLLAWIIDLITAIFWRK